MISTQSGIVQRIRLVAVMVMIVMGATVWLATPSFAGLGPVVLTSMATPTAVLGGAIQDVASTSTPGLTGTVTFTLFGPNSEGCITPAFTSDPQPLSIGGPPRTASASFTPLAPGTYLWIARYNGDATHSSAMTLCGDPTEISVVSAPVTTTSTTTTTTTPIVTSTSTTTTNPYPLGVTPPSASGALAAAATPPSPSGGGGYGGVGLAVAAMVAAQLILSARLRRRRAQAA